MKNMVNAFIHRIITMTNAKIIDFAIKNYIQTIQTLNHL